MHIFTITPNLSVKNARNILLILEEDEYFKELKEKRFILPNYISFCIFLLIAALMYVLFDYQITQTNHNTLLQIEIANRLNDAYALSELKTIFSVYHFVAFCMFALITLVAYSPYEGRKSNLARLSELQDELQRIVHGKERKILQEKSYKFIDCDITVTQISKAVLILLIILSGFSYLSKDGFENYLQEHKISGRLESIHYNVDRFHSYYTIFTEDNGVIQKLEIREKIPVIIKRDSELEYSTYDIHYRTHNRLIIDEKDRSIEYYVLINLSKSSDIKGTKLQ